MMGSDPTGEFWIEAGIGAVVGGVLGGISAAVTGGDITTGVLAGAASGFVTSGLGCISVVAGAFAGFATAVVSYLETSSSPNIGGAILAGTMGGIGGAIGGLVGVKNYGVLGTTVASYVSGLTTTSITTIGTTFIDTYHQQKTKTRKKHKNTTRGGRSSMRKTAKSKYYTSQNQYITHTRSR